MTNSGDKALGGDINVPPLFNRERFEYQNDKLISLYISLDPELWDMIKDSYMALKDATGVEITKKNLNADQKNQYKLHHKAENFFMNVITFKELDKCSDKKTTKSILNTLCLNYKGNKKVHKSKANMLVRK